MIVESSTVSRNIEALPAPSDRVALESVNCSFCGSPDNSRYDSIGEWVIVKCNHCGFCFTNPRPTVESLPSFYDLGYFQDSDVKRFGFSREDASQSLATDGDYSQRIADIESCANKRGSLFEIGAAVGAFLSVMRTRGWKVSGVEVSRDAVKVAKKNHGVDIFCGMLEEFKTNETYDVVCMYHSLEHTPDPAYVIERAYELLNPGGIVVIEVPNLEGFDARINRERRLLSYDLPRHLSHFTPTVLSQKLAMNGFEILDIDLYYPAFILRLAEARSGRRQNSGVDSSLLAGSNGKFQPNMELPMARNRMNWKTRLLRRVSELFPGWRFTIVARK